MATLAIATATMKAAQISKPGAGFEVVEREVPKPGAGQVRIKVQACGVCHSDLLTVEGAWPGIQYPRVPGHEVAGIIDAVGAGVSTWKKGRRGGGGWDGGPARSSAAAVRRNYYVQCSAAQRGLPRRPGCGPGDRRPGSSGRAIRKQVWL